MRAAGRADGALLLLDRAIAVRPDNWRPFAIRAEAFEALGRPADRDADQARAVDLGAEVPVLVRIAEHRARAGRYRESALLFDRGIARDTVPFEVWEWAALTHLADGDEEGYRRTCATMRSRYPASLPEPEVAWQLAHVCTLGPGGIGADGEALAWATASPGGASAPIEALRSSSLRLTGAVYYRSGRDLEAIESIRRGIAAADGQVRPSDAAFLAMALCRSGDRPGALAMLDRCPKPRDPAAGILNRQQQSADQLRREAERLIFGTPLPDDVFAP